MTQLALFQSPAPPPWWTRTDSAVIASHNQQDARTDCPTLPLDGDETTPAYVAAIDAWCETLHPRASEYTCRRCDGFVTRDGVRGFCKIRFHETRRDWKNYRAGEDVFGWGRGRKPKQTQFPVRAADQCEEWRPREIGGTATVTSSGAPGPNNKASAVWEEWKQRLGNWPAKIITALQTHKDADVTQLCILIGTGRRQTVYDAIFKLNRSGLITKSGDRYSLKQL